PFGGDFDEVGLVDGGVGVVALEQQAVHVAADGGAVQVEPGALAQDQVHAEIPGVRRRVGQAELLRGQGRGREEGPEVGQGGGDGAGDVDGSGAGVVGVGRGAHADVRRDAVAVAAGGDPVEGGVAVGVPRGQVGGVAAHAVAGRVAEDAEQGAVFQPL